MSMTIKEMRALANNRPTPIVESFQDFILDEAYYGSNKVSKIQSAMDKIYLKLKHEPNANIQKSDENRELQKAIQDVFGFQSVRIYWSNRPHVGLGPYTMPGAKILHTGTDSLLKVGSTGHYDKMHELRVYIQMDNMLVNQCDMNAQEMTAILLHEIGHNFDYSPFTVLDVWFQLYALLLSFPVGWVTALIQYPVQEYGRDVIQFIYNVDDWIAKNIPPIGTIYRAVGKITFNISKFLSALFSPVSAIASIPAALVFTPFAWIGNFILRKQERVADSFAVSYGYGPQLISGLDKLANYMTVDDCNLGIMQFFYDCALFQNDMITMAMGGHTSNQQRAIQALNDMKTSMNDRSLDPELRKECKRVYQECQEVYDKYVNMPDNERAGITKQFRKMVDNWYNGKNYMLMPQVSNEY